MALDTQQGAHAATCSAYVTMHTSACVSIREWALDTQQGAHAATRTACVAMHTLAYVSIRETEALGQPHLQRQALLLQGHASLAYVSMLTYAQEDSLRACVPGAASLRACVSSIRQHADVCSGSLFKGMRP